MKHYTAAIAIVALAGLGACSSTSETAATSTAPTTAAETTTTVPVLKCADVDGMPADEYVKAQACVDESGEPQLAVVASYDCDDGTKLSWTDVAYWTDVENVAHAVVLNSRPTDPSETYGPPRELFASCLPAMYGS